MLALLCAAGAGQRKKLAQAARLWARGELVDEAAHEASEDQAEDSLQQQFAALNVVPDGPVDVRERIDTFYLWPECVSAWQLFMAVQTQWRGGTVRAGLDYAGVQIVIDQRRVWRKRRSGLFAEICLMERAVLSEDYERRARDDVT